MWQDEFNGNSIDNSKWFVADWVSAKTQFTPNNVRFSNGLLTYCRSKKLNSQINFVS